jgi:hypothetical protein
VNGKQRCEWIEVNLGRKRNGGAYAPSELTPAVILDAMDYAVGLFPERIQDSDRKIGR